MLPLFLILGLFLFFTLIGQAVLAGLKVRFGVLWSWLLSPTMGMGITVLVINSFSKWGQPVGAIGPGATIGMAVVAIGILLWRRPPFPLRALWPVGLMLLAFIAYTGWPMFRFGFNWISYGNDDMANYTLAAERFLKNSYYFLPEQTQLEGTDYSQAFWFMHALQQIRPGSELLLSWACSITGLNPHQVFMPVIFALSLVQICCLGALVLFRGRLRQLAMVAMGLLVISPLFTLGTLYQLIAQVGGIALLIAACSLLLRQVRFRWNSVIATGLLVASMGITYPEVAPFIALSIGVYAVWLRLRHRMDLAPFVRRIVAIGALTFLFMGTNTYQFANTLILQSLGSAGLGAMADIAQIDGLVLFPWTLVPSFLPMVFGLHPFGEVGSDPWLSILIGLGIIFMAFLLYRVARSLWRGTPAGVLGTIMIPLGFYLFFKGQDFGLFKLGMFAQPVVAFALAQTYVLIRERRQKAALAVLVVYFAGTVYSHYYYVRASVGDRGGGLAEVVGASERGIAFKPPADVKYDAIESDITNVVSAKFLAMYTIGTDTRFLSRAYMDNVANIAPLDFLRDPSPEYADKRSQMLRPLRMLRWMLPDELMTGHVAGYSMMAMKSIDNSWAETSFRHLEYKNPLFVALQTKYDHFNKFTSLIGEETGWREQAVYMFKPLAEVRNRLVFIHSEKGPHYYSSARYRASFFQREKEPVSGGTQSFHGSGQYALFEVLNPSENIRLMVDFTRTSLGGSRSYLPTGARILGDEDYSMGFVGSGSARVFSQPIKPQEFEGLSYLTLDFGEDPALIIKNVTGLMRMYGLKYNLDDRKLVGFTRDISLITDDQYRRLKRPTAITKLPDDLYANPGLEYSGLFEDGWIGERAFVNLAGSRQGDVVTFKGVIPDLPDYRENGVVLTMTIGGGTPEPVVLHPGKFTLNRFVPADCDITKIQLQFSKAETYGKVDARQLSAFVEELSVSPLDDLMAVIEAGDRKSDSFQLRGLDIDGWAAKGASLRLPASSQAQVLDLRLEIPGWAPTSPGNLQVTVNGQIVHAAPTTLATYLDLALPLPAGVTRDIALSAERDFALPNQDKQRSYRVLNASLRNFAENEGLDGSTIRKMPALEKIGFDADGWAGNRARILVPASAKARTLELQIQYPGAAGAPATSRFNFTRNGTVVYSRDLPRGIEVPVSIPLEPGQPAEIVLEASASFPLQQPDSRTRSFLLLKTELK
ncbi:MAG: hypothetical protein RL324_681 [Verrucomicrobiota bacterium]